MGIPSYTYSVVREVHYGASISSVIVVHSVDHIE